MAKTADEMFKDLGYEHVDTGDSQVIVYRSDRSRILCVDPVTKSVRKMLTDSWIADVADFITEPEFAAAMRKCDEIEEEKNRLKPCPFCRCEMKAEQNLDDVWFAKGLHRLSCPLFGTGVHYYDSRELLASEWNRRVGDSE